VTDFPAAVGEPAQPGANHEQDLFSFETILTDLSDEGVLRVTLNRPQQLNAINALMSREFLDLLRGLREDRHPEIRVVVFTGAGDGFCSGADLSPDARAERPPPIVMMRRTADVAHLVHSLPTPTVAEVNGVAAGAGCNLALSCDLVVASETARFSEIFTRRGLSLDFGGSWLLPRMIGLQRAKELAFFGDVIDARRAEEYGIVNSVVAPEKLRSFVDHMTSRLSGIAPVALAQTKRLLNASIGPSPDLAVDAEALAQTINFATDDAREAIAAWMEKRPPVFRGS